MIKVVANKYLKPETKAQFLEMAKELVACSRQEEGNISYILHENLKDELQLTYIEQWESEEALQLHNESEHFKRLVPQMNALTAKPSEVFLYREII